MSDIQRLLSLMARLRDPLSGCPWDIKQNYVSLAPYAIEEAYEVVDAIERGDIAGLRDELGDLLLQVVFHAQMAQEQAQFGFSDVVQAICDKLIRRHPHVFAPDGSAVDPALRLADAAAQTERWEAIKRAEKAERQRSSVLDAVAIGLPETMRAEKLQAAAAKLGFDWPDERPVLEKLQEELQEVRVEFSREPRDTERLADEIGDLLFVGVNLARHAGVDAAAALRRANQKFERRFRAMEGMAAERGRSLRDMSLGEQESLWQMAKDREGVPPPPDSIE